MPTLFLHLGTAKTGTSSIQQFLLQNRELFAVELNLVTPETGREHREGSYHPLAFSFTENWEQRKVYESQSPERYAKQMRAELQGSSADVLLTSECFGFSRGGLVKFIEEVFPSYNVKIVMYVRRIDQYVEAAWSQHVKGRIFVESFDAFVQRFEYFNYSWLAYWQSALGLDTSSMIVVPYESSQFVGDTLLDDFVYRITGGVIPAEFKIPDAYSNPRLNRDALEYMLAVNRSESASQNKDAFRAKLIAYSRECDLSTQQALRSPGLLSSSQRLDLLAAAAPDDRRIAQKYLGREDGKLFLQSEEGEFPHQPSYPGLLVRVASEISEYIVGAALPSSVYDSKLFQVDPIAAIVEGTAEIL